MLKKIISVVLAALLCAPFTASAEALFYGFEDAGGTTETQNAYYFEVYDAILVENSEPYVKFDYEGIHAGSFILLPLDVYIGSSRSPVHVTDKMIKNDKLSFSYKVMRGAQYVDELTIVDGKKLKLPDVPAGAYIKIPFKNEYPMEGKTTISIQLVLAVNGITYQYTQTTLNCRVKSYVTNIRRNSVYGAKSPSLFKVDSRYSGEATFDFGDEIKYTAKVKKDGTYFLNLSREPNADIAAMYPGVYLDFYSFPTKQQSFSSTGKLEIPVDISKLSKKGVTPSLYVYRIDGSTLTSLAAGVVSFDSKLGKLTINTKTLDNYVLSNQPLERTVTASGSDILKSGYASLAAAAG